MVLITVTYKLDILLVNEGLVSNANNAKTKMKVSLEI